MNKLKSGSQGISGKNVNVGKMLSDHGSQTITASGKAKIGVMDNRGYRPRRFPFTSVKIGEVTIVKWGMSLFDSFLESILKIFKKEPKVD